MATRKGSQASIEAVEDAGRKKRNSNVESGEDTNPEKNIESGDSHSDADSGSIESENAAGERRGIEREDDAEGDVERP